MLYPSSLFRLRYRVEAVEFIAGALAPAFALLIRDPNFFSRLDGDGVQSTVIYVLVAAVMTTIAGVYFRIGQIVPRYLSNKDVKRILKASAVACIMTAAVVFTLTRLDVIPRSLLLLHFIVLSALLTGWRLLFGEFDRQRTKVSPGQSGESETIIVAGANDFANLFLRMLGSLHGARARVVALLEDDPKLSGRSIRGYPVLGTLSQADALIHEFRTHGVIVNRVVVAYPDEARRARAIRLLQLVCERHNIEIDDLSERLGFVGPQGDPAGEPIQNVDEAPRLTYVRVRHVLERVLAAVALVVGAPLLILIGLLVWLDVGRPLLFWQERVGAGGRSILVHNPHIESSC